MQEKKEEANTPSTEVVKNDVPPVDALLLSPLFLDSTAAIRVAFIVKQVSEKSLVSSNLARALECSVWIQRCMTLSWLWARLPYMQKGFCGAQDLQPMNRRSEEKLQTVDV